MIDHLFMLVDAEGPEITSLESMGLRETYRRIHPGQGTRNICYCFDNLYLELLWVDDAKAAQGDAIRRTGLYERSLWRTNGACPFGIAVRQSQPAFRSLLSTWEYAPPYLPSGMTIAVATDSDDPRQPMIFESPGSTSPLEWPAEKRGRLQEDAGLGSVMGVQLTMPAGLALSGALKTLVRGQMPPLAIVDGGADRTEDRGADRIGDGLEDAGAYRLCLWVASQSGKQEVQIVLPR